MAKQKKWDGESDYCPGPPVVSLPLKDNKIKWQSGCENCGREGAYDHHQIWGIIQGNAVMRGYSCKRKLPVLQPGKYWVRCKSPTLDRLKKKYKLSDYYVYQWEWTGTYWNGGPWACIDMKKFIADGFQLGPRVKEPKDKEFKEVKL